MRVLNGRKSKERLRHMQTAHGVKTDVGEVSITQHRHIV